MKMVPPPPPPSATVRSCARGAHTLIELMVAMTVFSLLITLMVSSHVYGLKMYRIAEAKMSSTLSGRVALNRTRDEIRSGKMLYVGNGDAAAFTFIPDNTPHIGNALQVYPTTNLGNYIRYYLDTNDSCLKRLAQGRVSVVARYVTNQQVFHAEDFAGTILTNNQNNRVIRMTLEFYQWEYPVIKVGAGGYDYFRLQTRVTRRTLE
jgi:type II secretory pathway pseudopilin PulG